MKPVRYKVHKPNNMRFGELYSCYTVVIGPNEMKKVGQAAFMPMVKPPAKLSKRNSKQNYWNKIGQIFKCVPSHISSSK